MIVILTEVSNANGVERISDSFTRWLEAGTGFWVSEALLNLINVVTGHHTSFKDHHVTGVHRDYNLWRGSACGFVDSRLDVEEISVSTRIHVLQGRRIEDVLRELRERPQ
jgi:hypothetical protein